MKLLELLFDAKPHEIEAEETEPAPAKPKKRTKRKATSSKKTASAGSEGKSAKKPSTFGPTAILKKLYDDGFFSEARSIADICQYSDANLARKIKPNEISGKLARMVRDGELAREKNSDNQYEYTKP